jgi:hypothetical protein
VTTVSETTNTTLHNILRVIQSGTVQRHQTDTGQWALTINNQHVNDNEIALGVSVLEAQRRLRWWPEYAATQKAVLTLGDSGCGRDTVRDWDHQALLGGRRWLWLEPALLNDSCLDVGPGAA